MLQEMCIIREHILLHVQCTFSEISGRPTIILVILQQRNLLRLACIARCCALDLGPACLSELFVKTSVTLGSRSLRSSTRGDIRIPFARTATMQKRACSGVGPTAWNDIPSTIRSRPSVSFCSFSI